MTKSTQNQQTTAQRGSRPQFRAWLVQDTPNGEAHWTELSGLWPTKSGNGYKGNLQIPVNAATGRIVILPAKFKPEGQ